MNTGNPIIHSARAAWIIMVAISLYLLVAPPRHPGDRPGWRSFVTPPVAAGVEMGQTFLMNAAGLEAVDIRGRAVGPVSGRIRLELLEVEGGDRRLIRTADVDAAEFISRDVYRFQFAPVADSAQKRYRVDVLSSPAAPATGVALLATKGARYSGGALVVNDRERWADLAFQVRTAAQSPASALLNSPYISRMSAVMALISLAIAALAAGVLLTEAAREPSSD